MTCHWVASASYDSNPIARHGLPLRAFVPGGNYCKPMPLLVPAPHFDCILGAPEGTERACIGSDWDRMEWNGIEWNGMEWGLLLPSFPPSFLPPSLPSFLHQHACGTRICMVSSARVNTTSGVGADHDQTASYACMFSSLVFVFCVCVCVFVVGVLLALIEWTACLAGNACAVPPPFLLPIVVEMERFAPGS